jgi:2-polyprenyl-6-methoxyphenol hydroxylase-like FAD-dependent oxidoreductase
MRVIICGAGVAGLSLGRWLAHNGWEVLIVERAEGPRNEGYMIDFFGAGYDAAELMGLIPRLEEVHYVPGRLVYVDKSGRPSSSVEYEVFSRLEKGRLMSFLRGDLERVLLEALPKAVEVRFKVTLHEIIEDGSGVRVTLSNGAHENADLLVGADGVHSRVRELVFGGERQFLRYLGYHTAGYVFQDQRISRELDRDFVNLTVPGRNVGIYPLRENRIASFFVHRASSPALPESPCAELRRMYGDLGWLVPSTLAQCTESSGVYYDQVVQVEMERWSHGRTTMIGDACCAVSLLAGQGASIAMASAYTLADELQHARAVEEALFRYEARLKPVVARTQRFGRRTARWVVPPDRWSIFLRNRVLNLARMPALSRLLRPVLAAGSEAIVHRQLDDDIGVY